MCRTTCGLVALLLSLSWSLAAQDRLIEGPDRKEALPQELEPVGVTEKLNRQVSPELCFKDSTGKALTFGDVYLTDRPVLLTLNYADCPLLCSLQLEGLVRGLKELKLQPGKDFRVVTVSVNPQETPERAELAKHRWLEQYDQCGPEGWLFLTGEDAQIKALAEAVGFRYVLKDGDYLHTAVAMLLTPQGMISRYLYGLVYRPQDLRLGLLEAGEGKIGTTMDRLLLYCYRYNGDDHKYAVVAHNVMKLGGALTLVLVAGLLGVLWLRELTRKKKLSLQMEATS